MRHANPEHVANYASLCLEVARAFGANQEPFGAMARLGLIPLPQDANARAALVQILDVVTIGAPLLGVLVVKYLRTIPGWESSPKYLMGRQILELLYPEFHVLYAAIPVA